MDVSGWPARNFRLLAAILFAALTQPTVTVAEPLPLPQVDYVATTRNEAQIQPPMTVRHRQGILRLEMQARGQMFPVLINFAEQTATVLVESKKLAGIAPAGAFPIPKPGFDSGAVKIARDIIAGEECDVWKFIDPQSQLESEVCTTNDGIWMRQGRPGNPPRYLVLSLARVAQEPQLFQIPADYKIVPFNHLPLN